MPLDAKGKHGVIVPATESSAVTFRKSNDMATALARQEHDEEVDRCSS